MVKQHRGYGEGPETIQTGDITMILVNGTRHVGAGSSGD